MRPYFFPSGATFVILLLCVSGLAFPRLAPPNANLDTFQIADGFQIEQIAIEPLIADPVAMEVDEHGNIFVAEMPGYPLDVSGKGRIRKLLDEDGDGQIDNSIIFAENIVLPTGLMRWKNGLLVTSPPDVLYLEDVDGDDIADTREVTLTGFARSNPQHNFNKPLYGLDNWIYLANNGIIWTSAYNEQFGGRGEEVYFPAAPNEARLGINANDRNVRFNPDLHQLESLAGRSQFGHTFDAWGHHFLVSNATPQYHEVIAARYLERNDALHARMAMQYTPAYGRNTAIFPITRDPEHQLLTDRGMITSAAGITYYLGGLFPEPYSNATFIAEPVHNLIHVLSVSEKGATFEATRIEEQREFLASTDSWFRPVNHYIGPDGALYVVDYNRQIVEHPEWMDDETANSGNLQNGTDRGRLYRITPVGTEPANWIGRINLHEASPEELVAHLLSPNIWWRRTAQRLLVDQQNPDAIPHLTNLLESTDAGGTGESRVHALWTLQGLAGLTAQHIIQGLQDPVAGVRENAIILAELHADAAPELWEFLLEMVDDPNTRVRFQLLCTLGYLNTPASDEAKQQLLARDIDDPWMQLAFLTSQTSVDNTLIAQLLPNLTRTESEGRAAFIQRLASLTTEAAFKTASVDLAALEHLASTALEGLDEQSSWWQRAIITGLTEGLNANAQSMPEPVAPMPELVPLRDLLLSYFYRKIANDLRPELLTLIISLPEDQSAQTLEAVSMARQLASSGRSVPAVRAESITLIAHLDSSVDAAFFQRYLSPEQPAIVQQSAIKAWGKKSEDWGDDVRFASTVTSAWPSLTPEVRNTALDVLMHNQTRMAIVLDAIEAGNIQSSALGWNRTVRLMRDTEGVVKEQARRLLSEPAGVRDEVVASYYESLNLNGDIQNGETTFTRVCSTCHQVAGELGTPFGPDLATVRHWSARALLAKILKPSATIADGYGLWSVKTRDGVAYTGLIDTSAPATLHIRQAGAASISIPRDAIENLQSLNATAMPAGLEQQLTRQEMADLIAFLRFN